MKANNARTLILFLLVTLLAVAMSGCSTASTVASSSPTARVITVSGLGNARGEPDLARLTIGVNVAEEEISEAVNESNRIIDDVTAVLRDLGVAESDIQTSNFSIWTEEQWDPETGQRREERLYRVDSTVQITVRQVDTVGEILQAAIDAGANNIYGLSFGIDDASGLAAEARLGALQNAREKAEAIAAELGVELGEVQSVIETSGGSPMPVFESAAMGLGGGGGEPPISEGSMTLSVNVQMSFAIDQ